jgi:hypothetical protein
MQELIIEFLFGNAEVQKGIAPLAIAGIAQGLSSLVGAFSAGKQKRQARRAAAQYERNLANLEANRQEIIDPYAGISDLSSMITNPFANLQVATGAAEMQAAESDISLASTLDTLRATGRAGGGATALAQAAARSKQGIAASIEQQEAQNARLRAQGEQQMQQTQMREAMRLQQADVQSKQFMYGEREKRELRQLDRLQGLSEQQRAIEAQARSAQSQAIGSLIGTAASFGAQALGGTNPFTGRPTQAAIQASRIMPNTIPAFENMSVNVPNSFTSPTTAMPRTALPPMSVNIPMQAGPTFAPSIATPVSGGSNVFVGVGDYTDLYGLGGN